MLSECGTEDKVLGRAMYRDPRRQLLEEKQAQPTPLEGQGGSGPSFRPLQPDQVRDSESICFSEDGEWHPGQSPLWLTHSHGN